MSFTFGSGFSDPGGSGSIDLGSSGEALYTPGSGEGLNDALRTVRESTGIDLRDYYSSSGIAGSSWELPTNMSNQEYQRTIEAIQAFSGSSLDDIRIYSPSGNYSGTGIDDREWRKVIEGGGSLSDIDFQRIVESSAGGRSLPVSQISVGLPGQTSGSYVAALPGPSDLRETQTLVDVVWGSVVVGGQRKEWSRFTSKVNESYARAFVVKDAELDHSGTLSDLTSNVSELRYFFDVIFPLPVFSIENPANKNSFSVSGGYQLPGYEAMTDIPELNKYELSVIPVSSVPESLVSPDTEYLTTQICLLPVGGKFESEWKNPQTLRIFIPGSFLSSVETTGDLDGVVPIEKTVDGETVKIYQFGMTLKLKAWIDYSLLGGYGPYSIPQSTIEEDETELIIGTALIAGKLRRVNFWSVNGGPVQTKEDGYTQSYGYIEPSPSINASDEGNAAINNADYSKFFIPLYGKEIDILKIPEVAVRK